MFSFLNSTQTCIAFGVYFSAFSVDLFTNRKDSVLLNKIGNILSHIISIINLYKIGIFLFMSINNCVKLIPFSETFETPEWNIF